jgi:MYXO-CTERM domain-containing protein
VNFEDDCDVFNRLYCFSASKFVAEEPFADVTFIPIPEPSAAALSSAALAALGLVRLASRRRRR